MSFHLPSGCCPGHAVPCVQPAVLFPKSTPLLPLALLDRLASTTEELGAASELATIEALIRCGSGAQRQRQIYTATQSLRSVLAFLCQELLPTDTASILDVTAICRESRSMNP